MPNVQAAELAQAIRPNIMEIHDTVFLSSRHKELWHMGQKDGIHRCCRSVHCFRGHHSHPAGCRNPGDQRTDGTYTKAMMFPTCLVWKKKKSNFFFDWAVYRYGLLSHGAHSALPKITGRISLSWIIRSNSTDACLFKLVSFWCCASKKKRFAKTFHEIFAFSNYHVCLGGDGKCRHTRAVSARVNGIVSMRGHDPRMHAWTGRVRPVCVCACASLCVCIYICLYTRIHSGA